MNAPVSYERAKSSTVAYLLWLFLGVHYLYFRKPGLQLLYWLTGGGFFVWALIDLFRIPAMTDEYNRRLFGSARGGLELGEGKSGAGDGVAIAVYALLLLGLGMVILREQVVSHPATQVSTAPVLPVRATATPAQVVTYVQGAGWVQHDITVSGMRSIGGAGGGR